MFGPPQDLIENLKLDQPNSLNLPTPDFPEFENVIGHAFDPLHIMWWNNLVIGV
jgi:hypothetical protein